MPTLHMLIGPPCSGKTTWVVNYKKFDDFVYSTDNWLQAWAQAKDMTYAEVFQSHYKDAEKAMTANLRSAIEQGRDIIWDQTNLGSQSRARKLAYIPSKYFRVAHVFWPGYDILVHRLTERNKGPKVVPREVFDNMLEQYQEPVLSEGFHAIHKEA